MKIYISLILFLSIVFQNSLAADTLLIRRTIKQILNSSGMPYNYKVIKQQFYNADGTLFREINYNDTDGQLTSYLFVFYRNGRIFTEEFYNSSDSLEYIIHHRYDKDGRAIVTTRFNASKGKTTVIADKKVNAYKNNVPVQIKEFNGKRIQSVTRCIYDESLKLSRESISWKSGDHAGASETREYVYNDGKLARINRVRTTKQGEIQNNSDIYTYNEFGHLTSIKTVTSSGSQLGELSYQYNRKGEVTQYEEFDAEGKRVLMLQYEYLKNFMEKGFQKSHYEDI